MKEKYIAPSCEAIEFEPTSLMAESGNITINKDPYDGALPSKEDNSGTLTGDKNGGGSLWDDDF